MGFDSIFDDALNRAGQVIENTFASTFTLQKVSGENLDINAIFDSALEISKGKNSAPFICENGALTVLNQRLSREEYKGAKVKTELGDRVVSDVLYSDSTTSVLLLSIDSQGSKGANNGRFIRTSE